MFVRRVNDRQKLTQNKLPAPLNEGPIMSLFNATIRFSVVATLAVAASFFTSGNAQAQGWYNPEIYNSGRCVTGARYDPFTGQIIVRTDQTKVRESYLDPNRNHIDPGSYRQVNRIETDMNGVRWHVTGTQWTSYGVPHGNLSRRRLSNSGGPIVEDRNEHVAYDARNNQGSRHQVQRPSYPGRQGGGQFQGGGVVEDRNQHVLFSTPSNSNGSSNRRRSGSSLGQTISRGILKNFSPF